MDFETRRRRLEELDKAAGLPPAARSRELLSHWGDGRIKLSITRRTLAARRLAPDLFAQGDYLPLEASGRHADRVLAFARRREACWAIAVTPRLPMGLAPEMVPPVGTSVWADTVLPLPADAPRVWTEVCSGSKVSVAAPSDAHVSLVALQGGGLYWVGGRPTPGRCSPLLPVALLRADRR